jgi:hypothetical protein
MIKRVEKNPGSPTSPKRGSSGLAVLLATGCASTGGGVFSAGAVALGPGSTALAANYNDLVAQGYRWATGDGPYASPTKDDLCLILKGYSEDKELELVEQLRVYYLVPGTIVQVVQNDAASGISQIRINGITRDLLNTE